VPKHWWPLCSSQTTRAWRRSCFEPLLGLCTPLVLSTTALNYQDWLDASGLLHRKYQAQRLDSATDEGVSTPLILLLGDDHVRDLLAQPQHSSCITRSKHWLVLQLWEIVCWSPYAGSQSRIQAHVRHASGKTLQCAACDLVAHIAYTCVGSSVHLPCSSRFSWPCLHEVLSVQQNDKPTHEMVPSAVTLDLCASTSHHSI